MENHANGLFIAVHFNPFVGRSLIADSDEATGGVARKDSSIAYDNISQAGSVQSMMSSDNDMENENDDNTENEGNKCEVQQGDTQPNPEAKPKVKMHKFNDHLNSEGNKVVAKIIYDKWFNKITNNKIAPIIQTAK